MTKNLISEDPRMASMVERLERAWEWKQESMRRAEAQPAAVEHPTRVGPYVAISREAGTGACEIARAIGQRLGWEVLDKSLRERVARRYHTSNDALKLVDETAPSWVYDVLGAWMDPELVPHERYVSQLTQVVFLAARRGKIVFVGRGAPFLLPRRAGLSVRIIASPEYRLHHIMQSQTLDVERARQVMDRVDRDRALFVDRFFHRRADDPHLYDLVINVEYLGVQGAAEQIIAALKTKCEVVG